MMETCSGESVHSRNMRKVVLVLVICIWPTSYGCMDGWILNENFLLCYFISTEKVDFQTAQQKCTNYSAYLAMPKTEAEDIFLSAQLSNINDAFISWMGMTDLAVEGDWRWVDGTSLNHTNYTHWVPGDPNNHNDLEHCVIFYRPMESAAIGWADAACDIKVHFVCQTDELCSTSLEFLNTTGSLITVGGYRHLDTLTYMCNTAQVPVYHMRTCLINGTWSGIEEVCQEQVCPPCKCNFTINMDDATFQKLIEDLTVDEKNTSKSRRSKISVRDDRPSAKAVGYVAVSLLTIILSAITLPDVPTLLLEIKRGICNIKSRCRK